MIPARERAASPWVLRAVSVFHTCFYFSACDLPRLLLMSYLSLWQYRLWPLACKSPEALTYWYIWPKTSQKKSQPNHLHGSNSYFPFHGIFTGTSYVALAVYPVICEVALEPRSELDGPCQSLLIASQHGISASPVSASTAAPSCCSCGSKGFPLWSDYAGFSTCHFPRYHDWVLSVCLQERPRTGKRSGIQKLIESGEITFRKREPLGNTNQQKKP